jgi:hypothetical protein
MPVFLNAEGPSWVKLSVAASEGKKTDEGTIIPLPELPLNRTAVADPLELQTSTSAKTTRAFDILTNCKISI